MNPNPRSETIFFTVPFGIAVLLLSNTEWNASALFEREECRPHARSPEGRATGAYFITLVRYGASATSPRSVAGGQRRSVASLSPRATSARPVVAPRARRTRA